MTRGSSFSATFWYLQSRKHTQKRAMKREKKASSCQFFSPSFSSHLVASIDNLLVFSLLREKMGEKEEMEEMRVVEKARTTRGSSVRELGRG